VFAPFLATAGAALVPHAQRILNGDDDTWKYFLVQDVAAKSAELTVLLHPELERLARFATEGEAAEGLPSMAAALHDALPGTAASHLQSFANVAFRVARNTAASSSNLDFAFKLRGVSCPIYA
jgi:hypothetical protein